MPLIYDSSWQKNQGTIEISHPRESIAPIYPPRKKVNLIRFLKPVGRLLVIFSFVGLLLTYFPIMALEAQQGIRNLVAKWGPKQSGFGPLLTEGLPTATPTPLPLPAPEKRFQLIINKIGADSCVLPNIDAADPKSYGPALQQCVAHAKGSGLPGEANADNRTIYLFAHSTNAPYNIRRYNAVFYSLKDLEVGNEITVWFWGKEYHYVVFEKKILEANDLSYFEEQTKEEQLILQTCYPPGTTSKQLVIIAKPLNW